MLVAFTTAWHKTKRLATCYFSIQLVPTMMPGFRLLLGPLKGTLCGIISTNSHSNVIQVTDASYSSEGRHNLGLNRHRIAEVEDDEKYLCMRHTMVLKAQFMCPEWILSVERKKCCVQLFGQPLHKYFNLLEIRVQKNHYFLLIANAVIILNMKYGSSACHR